MTLVVLGTSTVATGLTTRFRVCVLSSCLFDYRTDRWSRYITAFGVPLQKELSDSKMDVLFIEFVKINDKLAGYIPLFWTVQNAKNIDFHQHHNNI